MRQLAIPGPATTQPLAPIYTTSSALGDRYMASSMVSPTFVPIQASPLTLVPRDAIWKDPQRRRGVNELELWEQKQQQQQSRFYDDGLPLFIPPLQRYSSTSSYLPNDTDWQRCVPSPYLAHAITLTALDDDDDDQQRSEHDQIPQVNLFFFFIFIFLLTQ
ncbi:uncharacterized protein BX664DRAFT_323454 [Halteromyces radiatus]|uniref:uncharacterized protein n=1 Tax=Halteromyces radiatus TaxID=101107 RepID=UPI0022208A83|nr:uncharacterized protein BX664DRAFT_323454 [Halteromyces radiatus]KAI8096248.1 hypothetical protein BX664DRAFT_323454 [Halteromyces radiatus]